MTVARVRESAPYTFLEKATHQLLIGGVWQDSISGMRMDAINPASGEKLGSFPAGTSADIDKAVAAARAALNSSEWKEMMPSERGRLLWNIADVVAAHSDELALIETLDQGKPITHARSELMGLEGQFRFFAGIASNLEGQYFNQSISRHTPPGKNVMAVCKKEPIGVVGAIVPWNAPLILLTFKLAPALAAGCTIVVKPAEQTSLSTIRLGELLIQAGVPEGVVNIVTGTGPEAGAALAAHPGVEKVSFTGSTLTGRAILEGAKSNLKKVSLELGGKSPVLLMEDADLERAVPGVVRAISYNSGQICIAGSRLYAHRSIHDEVVRRVASTFESLKIGPGIEPDTVVGPMVNLQQAEKVQAYIETAVAQGANLVTGGHRFGETGCFVEPTILTNVTNDMACVQEEIFGPVLVSQPFETEEEAIELANDTIYGLGASVWTENVSTANRVADSIKAGVVWINGHNLFDPAFPMGGYKQSGWSRDSGAQAVDNFLEHKTIVTVF